MAYYVGWDGVELYVVVGSKPQALRGLVGKYEDLGPIMMHYFLWFIKICWYFESIRPIAQVGLKIVKL